VPRYSVHLTETISTTVEIEAATVEEALENVYNSPDMPGSITVGAFGQASVDESGDWEPVIVYDTADWNKPVWEADNTN
jgi:hypothetical protein